MSGYVYIVGAGPGDPELITVKALRAIQEADVILYDRLVNEELLQHAKKEAILVYCGKKPNHHWMTQGMINEQLLFFAKRGKVVTRLKGGDPLIFGRGGEEALTLATNDIPYEIVPGITSGIAASAYAGIPLTQRKVSSHVAFLTGQTENNQDNDENWKSIARHAGTLVIYMGMKNLEKIVQTLREIGRPDRTPVAIIHQGTTEKQRTITGDLQTIVQIAKNERIHPPSIIVVGEVVKLGEKINWFQEYTNWSDHHSSLQKSQ
ncbi:uroporphyrinogen-III C-methyltransferase [Aliibacillus thermotolerans]|uniref:uroporphyrinogen-III C-methyltransferase n=1 Tax=Aliibacillus thermotolerans TaxID=1834418 RepID=A0ABW0U410_9BACI|nr:uroporphyrinogen-III C-methyltransferase [Aliibacillus thermotolerans]MDA3130098.1 uroporphyrinogen-III C-methyltransferase [Aliibacillus thermotolerans]